MSNRIRKKRRLMFSFRHSAHPVVNFIGAVVFGVIVIGFFIKIEKKGLLQNN